MKLEFSAISLDRQAEYRALLSKTPEISSDYSFVNLWAWGEAHALSWAWADGLVWLRQGQPRPALWAPVGPWGQVDWPRLRPRLYGEEFTRLPESLAVRMARALPGARIKTERHNWDYLYRASELTELTGNRFHAKHNLLRQFQKHHDWRYEPLDEQNIETVLAVQGQWCQWHNCEFSPSLAAEDRAIAKVMSHFSDLTPLLGGMILVDGQAAAFTIGEPLPPNTLLIHFEKGLASYKGIYQAINREFVARQPGFAKVNREQDVGDLGLRQAKLSYHPLAFIRKYSLTWR